MRPRIRPTALLFAAALVALSVLLYVNRAPAQTQQGTPRQPVPTHRAPSRPGMPKAHGAPAPGKHAPAHEADAHATHGGHDAAPVPINWWHGFWASKEGVTPNLIWRGPEEPAPFIASLFNFAALVFIIVRFGKKPLASALTKRREAIMREIDEAQQTRDAAEKRLKEYEAKIDSLGAEIDRLRREFREQGEREKARILAEANDRRERMKQDAQLLLASELEQMRRDLMKEAVDEASRIATELLTQRMTLADHDQFVEAFFKQLRTSGPSAAGGPS